MEERRQFIRFKLLLKGEVEIEAGMTPSSKIQLIDFSRAGLKIFVPKGDFSRTNLLKLKVHLPNRHLPVFIQGIVKWIQTKDDGWQIGARIGQIDPADKNEILDYAYKIWREKKKETE